MKLKDIYKELNTWAPFDLQEDYDNSGLLIGHPEMEIDKILVALDVKEETIDEAVDGNFNLIISHHPIIFKGIKSLTCKTPEDRIIQKAIKHDVAIIAMHTNLDNFENGVNAQIGKVLNLKGLKILKPMYGQLKKLVVYVPEDHLSTLRSSLFAVGAGHIGEYDMCSYGVSGHGTFRGGENTNPFVGSKGKMHTEPEIRLETVFPAYATKSIIKELIKNHPYEEPAFDIYNIEMQNPVLGAGMIGHLDKAMEEKQFLLHLKKSLDVSCIRHSKLRGKKIKTVAYCGGAGSFLIDSAIARKADIFISGDIKYHDFFKATENMLIADVGHYESEQFTSQLIYDFLIEKFPTFAIQISDSQSNPIKYF